MQTKPCTALKKLVETAIQSESDDLKSTSTRDLVKAKLSCLSGFRIEEKLDYLNAFVATRIQQLHLKNEEDYLSYLYESDTNQASQEVKRLSEIYSSLETYFMRDAGQIQLLKNSILPEIIQRNEAKKTISIWCAACSSGEEAYSLAILLTELLPNYSAWQIKIIGTDINDQALNKAREGRYSEWSFRGCGANFRDLNFSQTGDKWLINTDLKSKVRFEHLDLMGGDLPSLEYPANSYDLIICRNLFIYLLPEAVLSIAQKLLNCLSEDGILMSGHGELYSQKLPSVTLRVFPESVIFQKTSARKVAPPQSLQQKPTMKIRPSQTNEIPPSIKASTPLTTPAKAEEAQTLDSVWHLANHGLLDDALQACKMLIDLNPMSAEAHYLLALIYFGMGDLISAKLYWTKSIYLDPTMTATYLQLFELYSQLGEAELAEKNRTVALNLLKKNSPDDKVPLLGESTATQLIDYLARQAVNFDMSSSKA